MEARSREVHNERAVTLSSTSANFEKFRSKRANYGLAIAEIVLGSGMFIFGIVSIFVSAGYYFVGHGIWCGTVVIIAGAFAAAAYKRESLCLMRACLVMNIHSSIFAGLALLLSCIGAADYYYGYYGARLAIGVVLCLFCATATIIAIVLSVRSCQSVSCCCCAETEPAARTVTSGLVTRSNALTGNSSLPTLEPTVAYIYRDGVMTPVDVFMPSDQSSQMTSPTPMTLNVPKMSLGSPEYVPEGDNHAPPGYREL